MIAASRGAAPMIVASSFSSAGLDCSSENSWMPAGRPGQELVEAHQRLVGAAGLAEGLSSAGVSSVSRSRASADCVAR